MLDEQVRDQRRRDPRSWGPVTWLGPLLVLAVLAVATPVLVLLLTPERGDSRDVVATAVVLGSELVLLGALLVLGRTVAARGGGWRRTFGLDRVRRNDWAPWLLGMAIVYVNRTTVLLLATLVTDGRALEEASNLEVGAPTVLSVVVLVLAAVVLAPVTEELMFRGLVLRAFMRRMTFWPAALLSSLLFALFHVPQVDTFAGAVTLALSVAVLGLGNCYLVRITGRLAPAMMVHASFNALSLAVAFAVAS